MESGPLQGQCLPRIHAVGEIAGLEPGPARERTLQVADHDRGPSQERPYELEHVLRTVLRDHASGSAAEHRIARGDDRERRLSQGTQPSSELASGEQVFALRNILRLDVSRQVRARGCEVGDRARFVVAASEDACPSIRPGWTAVPPGRFGGGRHRRHLRRVGWMDPATPEGCKNEIVVSPGVEHLVGAEQDRKRCSEAGPRATQALHRRRTLWADLAAEQDQGLEREPVTRARSVFAERLQARAQFPQGGCPDRPVGVGIGPAGDVERVHADRGGQAAAVDLLVVVAVVPGPDVRRLQHGRRPIVAEALVELRLRVALPSGRAQRIGAEVGRMARQMVPVLVVKGARVVRSDVPVATSAHFDQRAVLDELPARAEMDLAILRDGVEFGDSVAPCRQPVVATLERHPAIESQDAVAGPVGAARRRVVGVDHGHHPGQGRSSRLAQELVDISSHAIEVVVRMDLPEPRRRDVALAVLFASQRVLVDSRATAHGVEQEVALLVGSRIADRYRHHLS